MSKNLAARIAAPMLVVSLVLTAGGSPTVAARSFKNCDAMHKVYKHGVGKRTARDHTSGTPVTNFKRSNELYRANSHLDRDGDKIACESA